MFGLPSIAERCSYQTDSLGIRISLEISPGFSSSVGVVTHISTHGTDNLCAANDSRFQGDTGHFYCDAATRGGTVTVYIPLGAVRLTYGSGTYDVRFILVGKRYNGELYPLGESKFTLALESIREFDVIEYARPRIEACMRVLRAARGGASPETREMLLRGLSSHMRLDADEEHRLKQAMDATLPHDDQQLTEQMLFREPILTAYEILSGLVEIGRSHKPLSRAQVQLLARLAAGVGYTPEEWERVANNKGVFADLATSIFFKEDRDGVLLRLTPHDDVRDGKILLVNILNNKGDYVGATRAPYLYEDHFSLLAYASSGTFSFYIPYAVLKKAKGKCQLRCTLKADKGDNIYTIARSNFQCKLKSKRKFDYAQLISPIAELFTKFIDPKTIDAGILDTLRDNLTNDFELKTEEAKVIRTLLEKPTTRSLREILVDCQQRIPEFQAKERRYVFTVAVLASMHGDKAYKFRDDIQFLEGECEAQFWDELLEDHPFLCESKYADYFELFDLEQGASVLEIKQAYRRKVALHHPDKLSNASKKQQQAAHDMTIKLREAYEILLEVS